MRILSIVVGVVFFVLGQISFFLATYELMELQHEVNARLPLGEKFEPIFWSILTRGELRALQGSVLPNSPRIRRARLFTTGGAVFFVLAASVLYTTLRR
jgi:hypothetical protein